VRVLENTFSWSTSRAGTFAHCRRAYWWQYYGAWGGWEPDAPPEARRAYVLKNLSNRWAWVGSVVHERIERLLKHMKGVATAGRLQFDPLVVDVEQEIEATTHLMRRQYRESLSRQYRQRPKRAFGLMEHEYEDPVTDDEWREMNARARAAVRSFLESELFARVRGSDPATWYPIEALGQFELDGVPVWASPDFAMRTGNGVEIYDWKTGMARPEANRLQLACYTLYMEANHGVEPTRVRNHVVYLGPPLEVHAFGLGEAELDAARDAIRASMAEMREGLVDVEGNVAERDAFPLTDDLERCTSCSFRALCGR
jgi:CRISPR/Cas system-associated exonuclease Cas4 (RecB family)